MFDILIPNKFCYKNASWKVDTYHLSLCILTWLILSKQYNDAWQLAHSFIFWKPHLWFCQFWKFNYFTQIRKLVVASFQKQNRSNWFLKYVQNVQKIFKIGLRAMCKTGNCLEWPTIFIFFRSRGIYLNLLQLLPEIRDTM